MKPSQITGPPPKQMPQRENQNHDRDVEWKKVRRQRDEKVASGDDHVTASRSRFEFLDSPAEKPRPKRMSQFMAENINPHRLGQQEQYHQPTGRSPHHRHPD